MEYWAGDFFSAQSAWEQSLDLVWSPWAARNLGVLAWQQGRLEEAAELLTKALRTVPHLLPLAIESGRCLLAAGLNQEWMVLLNELPQLIQSNGRIRLLEAEAASAEDKLTTVAQFFEEEVIVDDLREGELSLTDLWFDYQTRRVSIEENVPLTNSLKEQIRERYPLPEKFDFSLISENTP
jgi:tetratricopeptide (TPR) repeat protein